MTPAPTLSITPATSAAGENGTGAADVPTAARATAGHVLGLVQQWLTAEPLAQARLVVVTSEAIPVSPGDDVADLAGAAAWGLVRSAQSENPGRLVLADLPAAGSAGRETLDALAAALATGEPELAVRNGIAYARRLTRPAVQPESAAQPESGAQPEPVARREARRAGTVLVTGGTGTLGSLVAGHLAATGQVSGLVLMSRSGPAAPGVQSPAEVPPSVDGTRQPAVQTAGQSERPMLNGRVLLPRKDGQGVRRMTIYMRPDLATALALVALLFLQRLEHVGVGDDLRRALAR